MKEKYASIQEIVGDLYIKNVEMMQAIKFERERHADLMANRENEIVNLEAELRDVKKDLKRFKPQAEE